MLMLEPEYKGSSFVADGSIRRQAQVAALMQVY